MFLLMSVDHFLVLLLIHYSLGLKTLQQNVLSKISQYKFELTIPCHKLLFRSIFDQYEAWLELEQSGTKMRIHI